MNIDKKDRTQLKNYFRSNAAPTEQNFKDFIDANLNQKEDGIAKIPDGPIAVQSATQTEELLHFYKDFKDVSPVWTISQKAAGRSGFAISGGAGASKLFIDAANGNIGVGLPSAPTAKLHLYEELGSAASANSGTFVLEHGDSGGQSSIVFKSKANAGADYGYLSFIDNIPDGSGKVSLLTIGSGGDAADHMALMPGGNDGGFVGIGTKKPAGRLHIYEQRGTKASATSGSILLEHGDAGGQSSIVFKSKNNAGSDFAYIAFQDDSTLGGAGEANILTISTQNDTNDHIALMPSGNVGIGRNQPLITLDVRAGSTIGTADALADQQAVGNRGTKVRFGAMVNEYVGMDVVVKEGTSGSGNSADLLFSTWESVTSGSREVARINGKGNMGLGINAPAGKLHLYEATGTKPTATAGTLVLEHGDTGGQSSIVFKSKNNAGSDFAYIAFQDDTTLGGAGEANILTISTQNESNDHIALIPSGNVGIGTKAPASKLHVAASGGKNPKGNGIYVFNESASAGQDSIICSQVNGSSAGNPFIAFDVHTVAGWSIGIDNKQGGGQPLKISNTWDMSGAAKMTLLSNGNMGLGIADSIGGRLHIYEDSGTVHSPNNGSIVLEHGNTGGESSIVFKSKNNAGSDYGYISFQDDTTIGGTGELAVLTIGIQNDGNDHVALMPSGNVGVGLTNPSGRLHIYEATGTASNINTGTLVLEHGNSGGQSSILFKSAVNPTSDYGFISYMDNNSATSNEAAVLTIGIANDGDDHIALMPSGNVGIGTKNPQAPLHVVGTRSIQTTSGGDGAVGTNDAWDNGWNNGKNATLSIFAEGGIGTRSFFYQHTNLTMSDERIKDVIGRSNAQEDLARLCQIQVTDYRHIDHHTYGNQIHKKVIAQEVEKVYPEAIGQRTETIPNIFAQSLSTVYEENSQEVVIELATTPDLVVGDKVDLIQADGMRNVYTVKAVNGNCFTVSSSTDLVNVFVYGKQVDDFRFVDYDSLFMLGVSAIQALSTEMDAVKQQLKDLQNTLSPQTIQVN
ncbi:MAG: tail fiber domain-containing protein [Flavobacteriia bacterium]|nr:tail fiber domain-containing protein [Flavobacteriia bacterium]